MRKSVFAAILVGAAAFASPTAAQVTRDTVPGVTNFARLETTVACGGVITPAAIAELKQRGYKSVFDLQLRDEAERNVDGEAAAAKAAGITLRTRPVHASQSGHSLGRYLPLGNQPSPKTNPRSSTAAAATAPPDSG